MVEMLQDLKVYTFIRTSYIPAGTAHDGRINQHWHDYYQLVYVRRGTGSIIIDGTFYPVEEGDTVIIRCNEPHFFDVPQEKLETYELKFVIVREESDFLRNGPRFFCRDTDGSIKRSLKQIEQESDTMDPLSSEIIALELNKIFLLMRRAISGIREEAPPQQTDTTDPSDALLEKINAYIAEHLHKNFTIRELSNHLYMEYSYLSRLFSAKYGIRLKQYINQKRLLTAKEMITGTNLTMTEIAEKCGFETLYRLERIFKKEEGLSPTEFRNSFQQKYTVMFEKNPKTYYQFENSENVDKTNGEDQNSACT